MLLGTQNRMPKINRENISEISLMIYKNSKIKKKDLKTKWTKFEM
jgi:hypothetical protein